MLVDTSPMLVDTSPMLVDTSPMPIDAGNSLPLSFGQPQNNRIDPSSSLSRQDVHGDDADKVRSKLSEAQRKIRREKKKQQKIAKRHAALTTASRDTHPDHRFPCPAPSCGRWFNRTGVLDHV
jgi:hypothetical protein